jgi:RNA polymerase primary sigma factor
MLSSYVEDIKNHESALTLEEEHALAEDIRKGDQKARDRLICANLRFVISIARKFAGQGLGVEDLIGAGNIGLTEAAKRYDPKGHNNEKFITFAVWYIKHYIFEAIAEYRFLYRIPSTQLNDIIKYSKAFHRLERKGGKTPDREDVFKELDISRDRFKLIEDLIDKNKFVNLSDYVSKAKGITYADVVCSDNAHIEAKYELRERRKIIFRLIEEMLEERDQHIVISYYGLRGTSKSLKELGDELGMSRENVRIRRDKALGKIKSKHSEILKDFLTGL